MRERHSATLPLPVLPAGLGLAGLGAGSGEAALAFLACGDSSGLGTRAAGGVLWVGAAGADVGFLGLSGVGLSCFGLGGGVDNSPVSSVSSLSAKESTSSGSMSSMRWASYLGQGPNFQDRGDCEGGRDHG